MELRSVRDEIIDMSNVKIYTLDDNILIIKDDAQIKKFTLTPESKEKLKRHLENVK